MKTAFITIFQINKVDNEVYIIKLYLELANLKQKDIKNTIKFIDKIDIFTKKVFNSQLSIDKVVI